jgi:hypothetical protein
MMEKRWCTACGNAFEPRPQSPRQSYCTDPGCQQARRRLWQKTKRRSDSDYVKNQAQAQRDWCERHPGYWRNYRDRNPDYTTRNRAQQTARNQRREPAVIAKSDASLPESLVSGVYTLSPTTPEMIAKVGVWKVRITLIEKMPGV